MKRKLKLFILVVFVFLVTVGCTNQEYEIVVNSDGTASYSQLIAIDYDIKQELDEKGFDYGDFFTKDENSQNPIEQLEPYFQETAELFRAKKFEIEPVNDSVMVGFKAYKEYPSIEELNDDIRILYQSGLSGLRVQIDSKKNFMGESYVTYGDLRFLEDSDFKLNESKTNQLIKKYGDPRVEATLLIRTPGELKKYEGELSSGRVKSTAVYGSAPVPISVSSGNTNSKIKVFGALVGLVALLIGLLFLARKVSLAALKRKRGY